MPVASVISPDFDTLPTMAQTPTISSVELWEDGFVQVNFDGYVFDGMNPDDKWGIDVITNGTHGERTIVTRWAMGDWGYESWNVTDHADDREAQNVRETAEAMSRLLDFHAESFVATLRRCGIAVWGDEDM